MTITLPANAIYLSIRDPTRYQEWIALQKKSVSKNGYLTLQIDLPRKPRTTGENSQCNKINGMIRMICEDTGNDFQDVKMYCKEKAIRRGYPFMMNGDKIVYSMKGEPLPSSEADVSTVEAGYLIEEIIQLGKELGIEGIERSQL